MREREEREQVSEVGGERGEWRRVRERERREESEREREGERGHALANYKYSISLDSPIQEHPLTLV